MNNRLTIRLLAALLCIVMLFSVACTSEDTTPQITPSPDTENNNSSVPETPDTPDAPDTPDIPETPGIPDVDDSEYPENGAEKIVTKTIKLYHTADRVDNILTAHYESTPDILLMDTETFCREFLTKALGAKGYEFTYEETDTTLTIRRSNGSCCVVDFVEDSMTFDNFDLFTAYGHGNMADILEHKFVDSEGNNIYFERTYSLSIAGLPVYIDLAGREIPLDIYEGKKYIPFQTFNDIFLSPLYFNYAYNSRDLFEVLDGAMDNSVKEEYYSIETRERSEALIKYTTTELCLVLDLFYGLQDEHGVLVGFDTYLEHTGLWEDLNSPDANKAGLALSSLTFGYLADLHSGFMMASPYVGSSNLTGSFLIDSSVNHFFDYSDKIVAARKEIMNGKVPEYLEVGNTAYITFDSFTLSPDRRYGYDNIDSDTKDTLSLIMYAHSQITRENSPIENVVLDLSCNSGGAVDAAIYVVAWMLGYCDLHLTNPITNSYATAGYVVDVNLDGVFDKNDSIADKNLYCITSPVSFSCGNLVPALLKESEKVTLLGSTSGGGACGVQFVTMADGSMFQFSSPRLLTVVSNGSYYTIDRGIEPHYSLRKFESYFNREKLTELISEMN